MCVFLFLLQNSNGIYTGFIKVQMELCKPSQAAGKPAPSSNGCMNTLHISSTNTVGEVIEALLKKFLVTESPTKFALYKRCHREDQGTMLKNENGPCFCFCLLTSFVEGWWVYLYQLCQSPGMYCGITGDCILAGCVFQVDSSWSESPEVSVCEVCDGYLWRICGIASLSPPSPPHPAPRRMPLCSRFQ